MKKFLRITGIVILLLIIALIALPFAFKGRIVEEVKTAANDNLNAQFDFSDLSLSLFSNFPQLTVDINDLSIIGIDQFADKPLITANELSLTVDVMSLFGETISVRKVALNKPYIQILVLEDGSANYDIAKASEEVEEEQPGSESTGGFSMNIAEYTITDGTIIYDDATLPMRMQMEDANHTGSGDFEATNFTLSTQTSSSSVSLDYDGVRYIHEAGADLQADLGIDLDAFKFTFMENVLKLNGLELTADGWLAMPEEDIDMDLAFTTPGTDFRDLLSMVPADFAQDLSQVDVSGTMGLNGYVKGTYNDTKMPGFGVDLKIENGRFKYPDLPESVENIFIDFHMNAPDGIDAPSTEVELRRGHMEIAGNPIDAFLNLKSLGQDPMIDATLKAKVILESLGRAVPLEEGDELRGSINADVAINGKMSAIEAEQYDKFKAEGQVIIQDMFFKSDMAAYDMNVDVAYLNFTPQHIELSNFKSRIGRSDIAASGKFNNYLAFALEDEMIQGVFNMNSELLDLNEFMTETEAPTTSQENPVEEEEYGVINVPSNVDFVLNASIDRLIYDDIDMSNAKGKVVVKDRVASFKDLGMNLLGGNVNINGDYSTVGEQPQIDIDFNIKDMDIKQAANAFYTIDKMAPIAKSCSGKFSTNLSLKAALNESMTPIEETIDGKGRVKTKSVNVEKFEPLNKLAGELGIERLAKQRFENLDIGYRIEDGKIIVDPFVVKLDGVPATIAGNMTMNQELDYSLKMDLPVSKLPGNIGSQTAGVLGQLNDKFGTNISTATTIPVSLKIGGTISKPTIAGNYGELVKDQAKEVKDQIKEEVKEVITEKVDEAKEEAIAKAKAEADKLIADAQKQADKLVAEATKQAEDLRTKGYAEAQKIEDSAKNPLEKVAKRALADKARKETDEQANNLIEKANEQAQKLVDKARTDADVLIQRAEEQ